MNPTKPIVRVALYLLPVLLLLGCSPSEPTGDPIPSIATTDPVTTPGPTGSTASCSAAGLELGDDRAGGVPEPVASTRMQIIEAALACNFERLEALAMAPDGAFQYSRTEESAGPAAQPAQFWRAREAEGDPILASLVEILRTDPDVKQVTDPEGPGSGSEDAYYNFPGPGSPDDLLGYSTSITSTGDWIFFLGPQ